MGNRYWCYEKKNGKNWFTPHNSMSKIWSSPPILLASTDLNLNQKLGKKQSSIINTYNLSDRQFEGCWRRFRF